MNQNHWNPLGTQQINWNHRARNNIFVAFCMKHFLHARRPYHPNSDSHDRLGKRNWINLTLRSNANFKTTPLDLNHAVDFLWILIDVLCSWPLALNWISTCAAVSNGHHHEASSSQTVVQHIVSALCATVQTNHWHHYCNCSSCLRG